jgi:monoterpene epsilon-lactone hydrolase
MSSQQLESIISLLRSSPPLADPDVSQCRAAIDQIGAMFPVDPESKSETVHASSVKAEWVRAPDVDDGRVILYLHGGGFVSGTIATHRALVAAVTRRTVASHGNRLSPGAGTSVPSGSRGCD